MFNFTSSASSTRDQRAQTSSPDHRKLIVHGNSIKNKKKRAMKDILANFRSSSKNANAAKQTTELHDVTHGDITLMSDGPTAIHKAAAEGRVAELEKLFLEAPARLSQPDSEGLYPLHHAAAKGQVAALDFIIANGADLNVVDGKGNTALHAAVQEDHPVSVDCLLQAGADATVTNNAVRAPIHIAVELNRLDALKELLKYERVDVDQPSELDATPLHMTAFLDHDQCAILLLGRGARLCSVCKLGRSPMHQAATTGASKTMQVFIKYAEKAGYRVDEILAFTDQTKSRPIHTAVTNGDHEAARICLQAGATIDSKQDDQQTPVHLACAQGDVEMVRLMFSLQPGRKEAVLVAGDVAGKTPIHVAALFDRLDVLKFLIENGADINTQDQDGCTPVMLGANNKSWTCVEELLARGADASAKDSQQRNILHTIIINGGQPNFFQWCTCNKKVQELSNEPDASGCTPLHYASMEGQLTTIDQLVSAGAQLAAKNNNKESPLHFAARYGRYNTCHRLLDSAGSKFCVNDIDKEGMTPLHVASNNGHLSVVQLLLQRGATPSRDMCGNSPVHLAASGGYTQTMNYLLSIHPHLINATNRSGNTALHLAARDGHANVVTSLLSHGAELKRNDDNKHLLDMALQQEQKDVCVAVISHPRWKEALGMCSSLYGCPLTGFVQYMPDVGLMVLDNCCTPSGPDSRAPDFHYTYNFEYLQMSLKSIKYITENGMTYTPLYALNKMVQFNRVEFLSHQLCLSYLEVKWNRYGMWFHMFNLLTYLVFLISLTCFVTSYDFSHLHAYDNASASISAAPNQNKVDMGTAQALMAVVVVVFVILNVLKEIVQMIQQRLKYFVDLNNALEWVLYVTSGLFITPFLYAQDTAWQWQCGAVAVFLAWLNLMLFLQRFDFFGIYVVMFLVILQTLLQVIIVFSILIIAFGMAFYILLSTEDLYSLDIYSLYTRLFILGTALHMDMETSLYSTPLISLATTTMMMMGNIEYLDTWVTPAMDGDPTTLRYGALTFIMLVVFLLLVPILLMNLLIGLAVGDIETVQKDARLRRLAAQVELHTDIEKKMPKRLLELVLTSEHKHYPNCTRNLFKHLWNKLTRTRGVAYGEAEKTAESTELDHIYQELGNQKQRWRQMAAKQDKLYDLLRLVVQKMEIKTEADDIDESGSLLPGRVSALPAQLGKTRWKSAVARQAALRQTMSAAKWASHDEK